MRGRSPRSAAIFNVANLPENARNKARGNRKISDLNSGQQAQANAADIAAVIEEDGSFTVFAPSGEISSAVTAVIDALEV